MPVNQQVKYWRVGDHCKNRKQMRHCNRGILPFVLDLDEQITLSLYHFSWKQCKVKGMGMSVPDNTSNQLVPAARRADPGTGSGDQHQQEPGLFFYFIV